MMGMPSPNTARRLAITLLARRDVDRPIGEIIGLAFSPKALLRAIFDQCVEYLSECVLFGGKVERLL